MRNFLAFLFGVFSCFMTIAQSAKVVGKVNNIHGEPLPFSSVNISPDGTNVLTGEEGSVELRLNAGTKVFKVSHIGFEMLVLSAAIRGDTIITFVLTEKVNQLKEVIVEGTVDRQLELFNSNQTSTNLLSKEDITSIPVLGGEADVIKTLQLLPGTVRGIEGSSDLFVRGGAADQNLVMLDGAPIYNTSHLFGFLSVFNPDMLDHVESINGGFPSKYGGRLSSILNVSSTSDIPAGTHASGEIGLLASRLMIEQPVIADKASFWLAGRRTYIDQVVKAVGEELPYYFYDLNGKAIWKPTRNNSLELGFYSGKDLLDLFRDRNNDGDGFLTTYKSGNNSQTLKWNQQVKEHLTMDVHAFRSKYRYDITNIFEDNRLLASSDIVDLGGKVIVSVDSVINNGTISGGIEYVRHAISPNVISTTGIIAELLESSKTRARIANEISVFSEYALPVNDRLQFTTGLRVSNGFVQDETYTVPEPRFAARYAIRTNQALKASYSRMSQYIHRISNSAVSTPTDIWYPVTDSIRPQTSHQIAIGWQRSAPKKQVLLTVEAYYKSMSDLVGYKEGTNLFFNTDFESSLIQGRGRAAGLEFLLRKDAGKFTGWISYTLSWSWRSYDEISSGRWFPSRYDRRHNGALVSQYKFHKRWAVSLVWEFLSGSRFTPVIGQYAVVAPTLTGATLIPVYADINSVKLADTHRLDLGLRFSNRPGRKFQWHWFAGVYNAYNRAAPVGINISQDEETGALSYEQPGLFGLLPFISYGFRL